MVNQQQMLYALAECRIDYRYVNIIKNDYENAKACIKLPDYMEDFPIERGVRLSKSLKATNTASCNIRSLKSTWILRKTCSILISLVLFCFLKIPNLLSC